MALRIEKDPEPAKRLRHQRDSYVVYSNQLLVAHVIEMMEWHLIDRKWIESQGGWAWGMDVTISARAAPSDLPNGGKAASLEEAIEKISEAWDLWVQYMGLAKTGT